MHKIPPKKSHKGTVGTSRISVFLSYNSADKPVVEKLAHRLIKEGIEPWLDKWNLIPGEPWQEAIEEALYRCTTCVVFWGPSGVGPWQNEEMRAAIDRRAHEGQGNFRVIPVLLPGAERGERSRMPTFLVATTWVEFHRTLEDEAAIHRLVCGIRGIEPGPDPGQEVYEGQCPFRGLQVFDVQHTSLFFGREALTGWLLNELRPSSLVKDNRFLSIVGPSGSGKSSLARAGLIAALQEDEIEGSADWLIVICRPGWHPLESLAVALSVTAGISRTPSAVHDLIKDLRENESTLHVTARLALRDAPPEHRLVLLVDQFEELFTMCHDEGLRQAFIENILYAARVAGGQAVVLLTLRSDFYGKCAAYYALAAALCDHQFLVGRMTKTELRRAIECPAQLVGCEFENGLVELLLNEVMDQPGALPLLQHTLLELWRYREGRRITLAAYNAIGKVEGALARRAEEIFSRFTKEEKQVCQRILLRLAEAGTDTVDTKRRVLLRELIPAKSGRVTVERVIQVLSGAEARLLTVEGEKLAEDERIVEVAHEALIHNWERLQGWLDEDREFLIWSKRLHANVKEWIHTGRDEGALLRGIPLIEAERWLPQRLNELNADEDLFIKESVAQREREQVAQERVRRRVTQTAVGAAVVLLVLAGFAAVGWNRSRINLGRALQNAAEANVSLLHFNAAHLLAKHASLLLPQEELFRSRSTELSYPVLPVEVEIDLIKPAALLYFPGKGSSLLVVPYYGSTQLLDCETQRVQNLENNLSETFTRPGAVWGAAADESGNYVAYTVLGSTDVAIWSLETGAIVNDSDPFEMSGLVQTSSFSSPRHGLIAVGADNGQVKVWSLASSQVVFDRPALLQSGAMIGEVLFHPTELLLLTCFPDSLVLEDLERKQRTVLPGADCTALSFSPGGEDVIYTIDGGEEVRVHRIQGGREIATLGFGGARVRKIASAREGRVSAFLLEDGRVEILDMRERKRLGKVLPGINTESIVLDAAGRRLAINRTVWKDGGSIVRSYSLDQLHRDYAVGPRGSVVAVGLDSSAGGVWVRTGNRLEHWSDPFDETPDRKIELEEHGRARISKDRLVSHSYSTSSDPAKKMSVLRIQNLTNEQVTVLAPVETGAIYGLAVSPSGRFAATGTYSGVTYLWDLDSGEVVHRLGKHDYGSTCLEISSDDAYLVSGSYDGRILVFRTQTGERIWDFDLDDTPTECKFGADSKRLVTAHWSSRIRVWDLSDGSLQWSMKSDDSPVEGLRVDTRLGFILTGSRDRFIRVWSLEGGMLEAELRGFNERVCSIGLLGSRVVASGGGRVFVRDLTELLGDRSSKAEISAFEADVQLRLDDGYQPVPRPVVRTPQ